MTSVRLPQHEDIATNDAKEKNRMKAAADEKTHAREHSIKSGDTVLVRQQKQNKLSTPFNPKPFIVEEKKATMITALNGSESLTRNSSQFKVISSKLNQGKSPGCTKGTSWYNGTRTAQTKYKKTSLALRLC